MFTKKQIKNILEKFYLSCNLPLEAFEYDGTSISSFGNDFNNSFDKHEIFEKNKQELTLEKKDFVTVTVNNAHFTGCFICSENNHRGLYIIGPYSNMKNNKYVYKPQIIIPQLISMLRILGNDLIEENKLNDYTFSFHVKKAIDYMDSRYKEEINLGDVADYLNINKCYLCSLIKKETGKTFTNLLNEIRVEKSKELLNENNYSALDIALAVGFNNQNYYNIMFKKITNLTPLEFKKNFKN